MEIASDFCSVEPLDFAWISHNFSVIKRRQLTWFQDDIEFIFTTIDLTF